MRVADLARVAGDALRADRRQASLASGGIVAGVAAVVVALAIGEGARRQALSDVAALGADNVIVESPSLRASEDDARAIAASVEGIDVVAPIRTGRLPIETPRRSFEATVVGVTEAWSDISTTAVDRGRWLSNADIVTSRRVAVLSGGVAREAFGVEPAMGRRVRIGGDWFVVAGVRAEAKTPDAIYVPLRTLDARLASGDRLDRVNRIVAHVRPGVDVEAVAARIERLLAQRLPPAAVQIVVPRALGEARLRARRTLDALLLATGTLVLAISGLGIMNVMLSGIARRINEIGVRRAVGARRADIVGQFAAEAVALCSVGGVAGLPLGAATAIFVGRAAGWTVAVSAGGLTAALTMAVSAGLVFGIYPALVAAGWTPAAALRAD